MVNRRHPLCKKKNIKLGDITKYPFILYRAGNTRKVVAEAFIRDSLSYEIVMEMDNPEIIKKFVGMGIGVSILSSAAITKEDRNRLAVFNANHLFGKIDYGIYYLRDKYISAATKQFVKFFAPVSVRKN